MNVKQRNFFWFAGACSWLTGLIFFIATRYLNIFSENIRVIMICIFLFVAIFCILIVIIEDNIQFNKDKKKVFNYE